MIKKSIFLKDLIIGSVSLGITCTLSPLSVQAQTYVDEVLADNPLGYWRLNETSGTTAFDSSGNGLDGTYIGGITLGGSGAIADNDPAAIFNGTNSYVQLPGSWGGGPAFTVSAWVNPSAISGTFQAVVSATDFSFIHTQLASGGNIVSYTDSGQITAPIVPQTPLDTWRHIVYVSESGNTKVFVDGVQLGATNATTFTNILSSNDVRIGAGFSGGRFFNGLIDEVAIYDQALSEDRILAHFNAASVEPVSSVPEPTSILGLVTLGLVGAGSALTKSKKLEK